MSRFPYASQLIAVAVTALLPASAAQAATLTYTFDASYSGEYADPNATALSGLPIAGRFTGLNLGDTLSGSVTVDYVDSFDLTGSFFGSGKVILDGQQTSIDYYEFYKFDAPLQTDFLAADEFYDEVFTFQIDGSSGRLQFDGMLDDFDAYSLSAYSAYFTLSNVSIAGNPEGPVVALASMPVPASLPMLGGGLLALWVIRRRITSG